MSYHPVPIKKYYPEYSLYINKVFCNFIIALFNNLHLHFFTLRQFPLFTCFVIKAMEIINNIKEYRKHTSEYKSWASEQELRQAKRIEYLKRNPDKINPEDIKRGLILLNAIDVMDEYSQSYAEDMEVATELAKSQINLLFTMGGTALGAAVGLTKPVKKAIRKIAGKGKGAALITQLLPSAIGMAVGAAASLPLIIWATKAQVSASRKGRFEAMNKDLKNPATFAILTEEQQKKAEETAKTIELEDNEKKRLEIKKTMSANPLEPIRTLKKYYSGTKEYNEQKKEFNNKLKESEKNFDKKLTEEEILKAKKDQQLLSQIVRKIDLASQDYAENTELATNTLTAIALSGGILTGWVSNKILNALKIGAGSKLTKIIPWAIGAAIPLTMNIYSSKIQKQASRVGRFKAKQEMLNNPESFVYVDNKNSDNIDIQKPEEKKKPNIFKFLIQAFKDNKEYENYRKTKALEELKLNKALNKIELTEQQKKDAQALQLNVFKTFNKIDEKSQTYSESVEALGEACKEGVLNIGSLLATAYASLSLMKDFGRMDNIDMVNGIFRMLKKYIVPTTLVLIPVVLLDILTTKEQKKASRVADMQTIQELDDYRHFAGYEEIKK